MRRFRPVRMLVAATVAIVAVGCGGDAVPDPSASPSTTPSATTSPSPEPTPTTPAPTATDEPTLEPTQEPTATADPCDAGPVLATVATAIDAARLAPVDAWSADVAGNRYAARTTTADEYASRLGFDCGVLLGEEVGDEERLLIAAWTGARHGWVLQTSEQPTTPYAADATVTVLIGEAAGEFLDGDTRAQWAGTLANGDTFVVGHADYNLGAAAKSWFVEDLPDGGDQQYELASERHAVTVLEEAGMREIGIAQPAQVGSAEGYVMFVSPTGQISVADVAPVGWFDPMVPRYLTGPTRTETIEGVDVRITEPGPDDPDYVVGGELGFACDGYVWILEPPGNGTIEEAIATATAIVATDGCRAG